MYLINFFSLLIIHLSLFIISMGIILSYGRKFIPHSHALGYSIYLLISRREISIAVSFVKKLDLLRYWNISAKSILISDNTTIKYQIISININACRICAAVSF